MSNPPKTESLSPAAASLIESVSAASKKGPPPVHLWNPPFSGDIDIRIARDGTWFHEGSPINRPSLVRLFASILKREDDAYFLVTPVEKVRLKVDDAPFVAVDFEVEDEKIRFETNVGDFVVADQNNPLRVVENPETGEPSPYIHIRRGLEALIDRKSFYRLAEIAQRDGDQMVVRSAGQTFRIGPAA